MRKFFEILNGVTRFFFVFVLDFNLCCSLITRLNNKFDVDSSYCFSLFN